MTYRMPLPEDDPYPLLRESLAPEFHGLEADEVESLFGQAGLSADDMEWSLGRAFRSIGRTAARLAPTVLPIAGTALGTVVGGPVGAAVGGSLGRLAGGAVGAATTPGQPRAAASAAGRRPTPPAARAPGASPAAAQLLQVLSRPEVLRALQSMALGRAGTPNVTVGSTPVPVGAIANLLGTLASSAASEHHVLVAGGEGGVPEYLLDADGEAAVDIDDAGERAQRLLGLMEQALLADALEVASLRHRSFDAGEYDEDDSEAVLDDFLEEDLWDLLDALDDDPGDESYDLDEDDVWELDDDPSTLYGTRYV